MCRSPRNRGSRRAVIMAGGSRGGGGGADHLDRGKKPYQRHTAQQIQILEETFNDCQHPDEKLRAELSQEMGLTTRQIKFWFQNRRTQMKARSEMADICMLKTQNDKMRSENIAIKETLKKAKCSTCGGPHSAQAGDNCDEEQSRLLYENAQLKEELERISGIIANYIGPLTSQFPTANLEQSNLSSEKLSMVTNNDGDTQQTMTTIAASDGPSLDLDLLTTTDIRTTTTASNNTLIRPSPKKPLHGGMHKSLIVDIMNSALDELMKLFQTDDPLWTKLDGRDVLDIDIYKRMFPRPNSNTSTKKPYLWMEASRATAYVMMDSMQLLEMFNDSTKWGDLFPTIVLKARTIKVISPGFFRNPSGSLKLMYEELQMASPLVPIRQFIFIRFIRQIDQTTWAVVDFSYDHPQYDHHNMPNMSYSDQSNSRRLPSGCLIQRMPNGCSKVTWVEQVEIEDKIVVPGIYRDLIYSGLAFGAERWIACLQRSCEKIVCQTIRPSSFICELGGVIPSDEGRKSVMKLAKRMMKNFYARISPSSCDGHLWSCVSDFDNFEVFATLYKYADANCVHPNTTVLSAAATVWLPHSPQSVFNFLRDERNRPQWDVLAYHTPVQEVTHIANGAHLGNCVSVLRGQNNRSGNILILQESCTTTDSSGGSLLVYCPVDLPAMNLVMCGEEPDSVPLLLPSGFVINTDGRHSSSTTISTSSGGGGGGGGGGAGSLVTVVAQMMVSSLPWAKIGAQSVATVNNLIGTRVRQIKSAMDRSVSAST